MYANQKLYRALSEHNTFIVNGNICSGGAYSALVDKPPEWESDPICFINGNFEIITDHTNAERPSAFPPKNKADYRCWYTSGYIIDYKTAYGNNYVDYIVYYDNGQVSKIRGFTQYLPHKVSLSKEFAITNLVRKMLINTELSGIDVSETEEMTIYIVLDLNRINREDDVEKAKYVRAIYDSLGKQRISNGRIYPVVVYNPNKHIAVLGLRNVDTYEVITGSIEIDEAVIMPYVAEWTAKYNTIYKK